MGDGRKRPTRRKSTSTPWPRIHGVHRRWKPGPPPRCWRAPGPPQQRRRRSCSVRGTSSTASYSAPENGEKQRQTSSGPADSEHYKHRVCTLHCYAGHNATGMSPQFTTGNTYPINRCRVTWSRAGDSAPFSSQYRYSFAQTLRTKQNGEHLSRNEQCMYKTSHPRGKEFPVGATMYVRCQQYVSTYDV
jgi:hypothetical protein